MTVAVELTVGNLDVRLPPGATVDLDQVRTRVGTIRDRTARSVDRGSPHLIVRGGTGIGNVRVRY